MSRYKLILEYDGTLFSGWQRQENALSVQGVLEEAIQNLTKLEVRTYAAGRTDAGVHATYQVVHFDIERELNVYKLPASLNFFMRPYPVGIISVEQVQETFHARFSAKSRSYIYKILNRQNPSALLRDRVWHIRGDLNIQAMDEAAQLLVGNHDFTSFRSSRCQSASPVKTINSIKILKIQELIEIHINAPSFLHNQVRIITGVLKKIGDRTWNKDNISALLKLRDRTKSAPTAPACGLYLCNVEY
jgi:tRNA pseudouridine38-40 synthase